MIDLTNIDFLNALERIGVLNELTRRGMLPISIMNAKSITEKYNEVLKRFREETGNPDQREAAANEVARLLGCHRMTVYRSLQLMKEQ